MDRRSVIMLLIGIISIPVAARAVHVLPVNLDSLVEKAGVIIEGTCIYVDYRTDEQGIIATYTTFNIHQSWKRETPQILTIKTYGGSGGSLRVMVPGMSAFEPGERVVLFLHPASETGFTSPVGMGQGSFKIFTPPDGGDKVVNDDNNRHLFHNMDWDRLESSGDGGAVRQFRMNWEISPGPVDYEIFTHLVETLILGSKP